LNFKENYATSTYVNSQILNLIKISLAVLEMLHENRHTSKQDEASRYIFAVSLLEEGRK
jgi:hypothetical protein